MSNMQENQTVHDPTVGGGVMLLIAKYKVHEKFGWRAASKFNKNLSGQDLSITAWYMSQIQLILTNYSYMAMYIYIWLDKVSLTTQIKLVEILDQFDIKYEDNYQEFKSKLEEGIKC